MPAPEPRLPVFPLTRQRVAGESHSRIESIPATVPYQFLHQDLLERYAPPSILVGPDNRLVHLSENAGRYLIHPGGEITASALRLVRNELRIELQALLQLVRDKKELADSKPIAVHFNGHQAPVVMHVRPAQSLEQEGFVLVIFEEHQPQAKELPKADAPGQETRRLIALEAELSAARQQLQTVIEEYETSREEMKASNEEMQSTNEELRSTMEELETSKEELQSINEELQTVNQENRHKVEELSQLSSDLQNLLSATDIATLFLDRDLRIMRFTPRLADLFNVRVTDRGRPISDLTHRLGYLQLRDDAQAVLDRLVPIERDIRDDTGRWYLTRVLPYRSTDDRIEGVVITFTDMTSRKVVEVALREEEERQACLLKLSDALRTLTDPVLIQEAAARLIAEDLHVERAYYSELDFERQIITVQRDYYRLDGPSLVGEYDMTRFPAHVQAWRAGHLLAVENVGTDAMFRDTERSGLIALSICSTLSVPLLKNEKPVAVMSLVSTAPRPWKPEEIGLVEAVADRTWAAVERARAEASLRESEELRRIALEGGRMGTWRWDLREELLWGDAAFLDLWGFPPSNKPHQLSAFTERMSPKGGSEIRLMIERAAAAGEEFDGEVEVTSGPTKGGWVRWRGVAQREQPWIVNGVSFDATEQKLAEGRLRENEALTLHSLAEKEELLKEVHHRVKNNLQVIISLLNMQTLQIQDERVLALFQEARNRVLAISSIHELLYRAESFANIQLADYSRQLVPGLVRFYGLEERVQVEILGDGTTLELERAVPYGMLLNELVSNACKHAFSPPETGTITISIRPEDNDIVLTVADTGPGLPDGFNYQKASSLGLKLVHGLVRQLRGSIEIVSKPGTTIRVRLPATDIEREE